MFRTLAIAATTATLAVPAFADGHAASGDAAAGEKAFRQCISCHVVQNEAGDTLAGRNAKTGPNLYGIARGPVRHGRRLPLFRHQSIGGRNG